MKMTIQFFLSVVLLLVSVKSFSQRQITGRVTDEQTKKPVQNATVVVPGKEISTRTNVLGFFQLTVEDTDSIMVSSGDYHSLTFLVPEASSFQIQMKQASLSIYRGGMDVFYDYIGRHIRYPYDARASGRQGYVYVGFQIDSLGNLKDVDLLSDIGGGCGKEALRVLMEVPSQYIPDASNSLYILPIVFNLDDYNDGEEKSKDVLKIPVGKKLPEIIVTAMRVRTR